MIKPKIIKKLSKKVTALILSISMLFTNIMPISTVFALEPEEKTNLVELMLRDANGININDGTATINYNGGTVTLTAANLSKFVEPNWNYGDHTGPMQMLYTTDTSLTFNFYPEEGYIARYFDNGQPTEIQNNTYVMNNLDPFGVRGGGYDLTFNFDNPGGGGGIPMPSGETYQVDFGTASWNVDGVTVTASIEGKDLTDGFLDVVDSDIIVLTNFNPDTMTIRVYTADGFSMNLIHVNGETCLAYLAGDGVLPPEDLYFEIISRGNPPGVYTVDFGEGQWDIDEEHVSASIEGINILEGPVNISHDNTIHLSGYDQETMEIHIRTQSGFHETLFVDDNDDTCIDCVEGEGHVPNDETIEFSIEGHDNPGPGPEEHGNPPQEGNHTAIIRVNGIDGTYTEIVTDPDTGETSEVERPYDGSGAIANETKFNINDGAIWGLLPEGETVDDGPMPWYLYNQIEYQYDEEEGDTTIDLGLYTEWDKKFSNTIRINNVDYLVSNYLDYGDMTDWINHVNNEYVGFVLTIPKAEDDIYEITVQIDYNENSYVGQFEWTNDPGHQYCMDEWGNYILDGEDPIPFSWYIANASIQLVGVDFELNNQTYHYTETDFSVSHLSEDYLEYEVDPYTDYNVGRLYAPSNATITVRIVPNSGYQITEFLVTGGFTIDEDKPNEYTFAIPVQGSEFFVNVEEVDDFESNSSENIISGSLNKGNATELQGTTDFIISDSDLTGQEKQGFVDYAEGYTVREYFKLTLNQVFFRGNSESAWISEVESLRKKASVTLQFANSIDYDDLIIIRKTGENTFETIDVATINRTLNRLSFETKRFGEFALATRTFTEIENISLTLEPPTAGVKVNVTNNYNEEFDYTYFTADVTPNITVDANAPFTVDSAEWVNGICGANSTACDEWFNGTFSTERDNYAMIHISSKDGYKLTYNSLDGIRVNGRALDTSDGDEIFNIYKDGDATTTFFVVKIATAEPETPTVKGDFNDNGQVDLSDIIYLLKRYLNIVPMTAQDILIGDMNDDGEVGLRDIILLLREYLGV